MLSYGALSDSEVFRRQNYSIVTGPSLRHNQTQQGQGVAAIHSVTVSTCADPKMPIRSDRRKKPIAIGRRAPKGKSEGGQNAVRVSPEIARTGARQGASARAGCDAFGGGGTFGDHADRA